MSAPMFLRAVIAAMALAALSGPVAADEKPGGAPADAEIGRNAALYCANIADAAADARYARQANALHELEARLAQRIEQLEAKRAEFEDWVRQREDLLNKADESVVAIYSQMRPDAAAQQFAVMEAEAAAAILAKVSPRIASAILNEMDATTAAHLTNVMAGHAGASPKGTAG